jgi:hypothetical protein
VFLFEKQRARGKPLDQKAKIMAIYRCNLHPARASAIDHSRYIAREGRYSELAEKRGETIYHGAGNLPEWANAEASLFWEAAEKYERANANHYREFEVALPRELSHEQMESTVKGFSQEQFGERHAYEYALHLNANNPHAHIMFSEKMNDGLARSEEQYFKRYNPKKPERGGCKKSNEWEAQRGNKASERLLQAREAWATHVNHALERAGHEARVDHRSYEARGIDQIPEPKVGPKVWYQPDREQHPRFQDFKAVRELANQVPQERANLAAVEADLGAAKRELEEIMATIREMEARELKARQQEVSRAQVRGDTPQRPQNAPEASFEEKAQEIQKGENSPSGASARPAQATRVWFAFFDSQTWETRAVSQRILSREQNSPEVQARISLEVPPKCVLSEDGRTWSGVFRDGIEAANYGRAQALEKRKAESERNNKEYIEKKNQEKLIQDEENELLKKFRNEIYSYNSAVLKEKMVIEKINEIDLKIVILIKESEEHSKKVKSAKWHGMLNPWKIVKIDKEGKKIEQEYKSCLEMREYVARELEEVRKVKDIFWRREAPQRKLAEAEKEKQRQERAQKFEQEKAKRELELERRRQRERQRNVKDRGQSR